MAVKLKKNIALSESGFIFDPSTGDSFSVNGTGLKILEYLKSGVDEAKIVKTLSEIFDADEKLIREDLDDFINHLKQLKMIVHEVS
jgi:hypothetical protein